jgi:hypothetical protein
MSKQGTLYNNNMIALKRQSEKQMDVIRKLEERERHLTQLSVTLYFFNDIDNLGKRNCFQSNSFGYTQTSNF